jgi:TP901 family phage tail tape measure protein
VRAVITGSSAGAVAAFAETSAAADKAGNSAAKSMESSSARSSSAFGSLAKAGLMVGAAVVTAGVGMGVVAVKMAADFQSATTTLITGAGESVKNIDLIRTGILSLAGQVGQTPAALAAGMYQIESAGYHGAAGLAVLKAAAEGAAVGGANMSDVANVLTSALNAYSLPASSAVAVTNDLIATVASGKMKMADLAVSLGAVLAPAAAVGVNLGEVSAAIATMTMQGTPAADAATYLKQMLVNLSAETPKGAAALKGLGMSADTVASGLKKQPDGLIAQLRLITEHLDTKFPASAAVAKAQFALVASGSQTADQALANLAANGGTGYINALKSISGGSKNMMAMLELTGSHLTTLQGNFNSITGSVKSGGTAISGWALVQQDFNQKVKDAKAGLDAFLIQIGQMLLPVLSTLADLFTSRVLPALQTTFHWIQQNADAIKGGFVTAFTVAKNAITPFVVAIVDVATTLAKWGVLIPIVAGLVAAFVALKTAMLISALIEGVSVAFTMFSLGLAGATAAEAGAATGAFTLGAALNFAMGPIGLIIIGIAAVVAVGVLLVTHWQQVVGIARTIWTAISGAVVGAVNAIKAFLTAHAAWLLTIFSTTFTVLKTIVSVYWTAISTYFTVAFKAISAIVTVGLAVLSVAWTVFSTAVKVVVQALWDTVAQIFKIAFGVIQLAVTVFTDAVTAAFKVFAAVVGAIFTGISTAVVWVWNNIKGVVIPIVQGIVNVIGGIWNGLVTTIQSVVTVIGAIFVTMQSALRNVWNAISSDVVGIWNGIVNVIKGAVNTIISVIDTIISGANKVTGAIPFAGASLQIPLIPHWYAAGGFFDRPTVIGVGESGPEVVLNRPQLQSMMVGAGAGGGGYGGGNPIINQTFHINGGNPGEVQATIRREFSSLVTALRSGRK